MKVKEYSEVHAIEDIKGISRRDLLTADDGATVTCVQIIEISPNVSTPSHFHAWEHQSFILSGKGLVIGGEGSIEISQDTSILIPANEPHCFVNVSNENLRILSIEPLKKE